MLGGKHPVRLRLPQRETSRLAHMEERLHNRRVILSIFVLLLFAAFGTARHLQVPGDDLAPSYCACRLLAADQGYHLFSRDAHNFDVVHDPVWLELGRERQLPTAVHPYVQSPLWAFSLRPLCTRMNYPAFRAGFLAVVSAALVATGSLFFAPRFTEPKPTSTRWFSCRAIFFSSCRPS